MPRFNGESGEGRFGPQLVPKYNSDMSTGYARPVITIEFEFASGRVAGEEPRHLVESGVRQIADCRCLRAARLVLCVDMRVV